MISKKYKLLYILSALSLTACGGSGSGNDASSDAMPNKTPSVSPNPSPNPTPNPTPTPEPIPNPTPEPEVIPEGVALLTASIQEPPTDKGALENVIIEFTNQHGHKFSYPIIYLSNGIEIQSGRYTVSSYAVGDNEIQHTLSHYQVELYPDDNKTIGVIFQKVEPEPEPEESEHIALMPFKDVSFNMLWSTMPPRSNLQEIADVSKHYDYVLAFITQNASSSTCFPAWGGSPELALDKALYVNEVNYLKNQGGHVGISFGGENGSTVASKCTLNELITVYQEAINTYDPFMIDFDVEGGALGDTEANNKRIDALLAIKQANPNIKFTFTLPANIDGFPPSAMQIIQRAKEKGLEVFEWNMMTMAWYAQKLQDKPISDSVIAAAEKGFTQLKSIYQEASDDEIWQMIRVTPKIGVDYDDSEFYPQDAYDLQEYVKLKKMAGISFWSMDGDRNQNKTGDLGEHASPDYSGVEQAPYDFTRAFLGKLPTPTPTPDEVSVKFTLNGIPSLATGNLTLTDAKSQTFTFTLDQLRSSEGIALSAGEYTLQSLIIYNGVSYILSTPQISISQGMSLPATIDYTEVAANELGYVNISLTGLPQAASQRMVTVYDALYRVVISKSTSNFMTEFELPEGVYHLSYEGYLDEVNKRYYSASQTEQVVIEKDSTKDLSISYTADSVFYKVGAYYPAWGTYDRNNQIHDLDAKDLDVLYYAFLNFDSNGNVSLGDSYADIDKRFTTEVVTEHGTYKPGTWSGEGSDKSFYGNLERIAQLKGFAKEKYNNTLIAVFSIGGWTWSTHFAEVARDPVKRENFANTAAALVQAYDMDGLDLDWEFPVWGVQNTFLNAAQAEIKAAGASISDAQKQAIYDKHLAYEEADNYVELIKVTRQKLNELANITGKHYHLSIAINQAPDNIIVNSYSKMMDYLDSINIMSYDAAGTWDQTTGNQAPLSAAEGSDAPNYTTTKGTWNLISSVAALNAIGVPNNKIVAGIPLYGRQWVEVAEGQSHIPGVYQTGNAGNGEWEVGNLGYNCIMGGTFSAQKTIEVCQSFEDTASEYTYILVRDNNEVLRSVGNFGEVTPSGYRVSGILYPFDKVIESYYYNPISKMFITYDSATMVNIKGQWIKQQGLQGGMFWDTSGDVPNPSTNPDPSLIDTLSQTFSD